MFKNRPNWLNSENIIPYESGYLFYNYDYGYPLITQFNSGTLHQGWVSSVPLASSIESTMEWLDRTARDQFIPYGLSSPLISTGFEWKRYNGEALETFVPRVDGSGLRGYPWHVSGVWQKYRDNLDYTQKRVLLGPRSDSKTFATIDDNYILNNYFDGIQPLSTQATKAKLTSLFYHNFIPNVYKAIPYFACFNLVVTSSCQLDDVIKEYNPQTMESVFLGMSGTPQYSCTLTSRGLGRIGLLPVAPSLFEQHLVGSSFVHYHTLGDTSTSPALLGSDYFSKGSHTVMPFGNFDFLGNLSESRYTNATSLGYTALGGGSGVLSSSGNITDYYAQKLSAASVFVYPVSFSGLKNSAISNNLVWPVHSLNGDSNAYPFHSMTGISGITVNSFYNQYTGLLDESLYLSIPVSGGKTLLGSHYQNLEQIDLAHNMKFVYGFVGPGNLAQNIANKLTNLDYTELPITQTLVSVIPSSIPGLHTPYPDFASGVPYGHIAFTANPPNGLYSYAPTSNQYMMSCDISAAMVAIPPVDSHFLFFALFESPFFNHAYSAPSITPIYNYPPYISGASTFGYSILRHNESVQSTLFQIVSNYMVSGVAGAIFGVAGDHPMDSVYKTRAALTYNLGPGFSKSFDMSYSNYGYSTKLTPGYLANGPVSGILDFRPFTGTVTSGIIPSRGIMYGF